MMRNGRPKVVFLRDIGIDDVSVDISLSHCREYAVAYVVVVW